MDVTKNKLVVDFDPHWPAGIRGTDAGITAETKLVFGRWPVKLSELKPGMRVHVIRYKDSKHPNVPDEVRASWPPIRPNVTGVNLVQMEITFEYAGEHGIALEVTLPLAPDTKPILDGVRSNFSTIPRGKASWLSLSSDKKSVIDVTSFTGAYGVSGRIASHDYKPRVMTVTTGPDKELTLPVADDVQIMVDGEDARFIDVRNHMRVLIRTQRGWQDDHRHRRRHRPGCALPNPSARSDRSSDRGPRGAGGMDRPRPRRARPHFCYNHEDAVLSEKVCV